RLHTGLRASELYGCIHVAESGVVSTRDDARNGGGRAFTLVNGDVQAFGVEIAFVFGPEHEGMNALVLPVEGETDRCWALSGGARCADEWRGENLPRGKREG